MAATYNGIHMVAFQLTGVMPTTAAQIQALADLNDIVILQPRYMKLIGATLKADNPNLTLLVYENGMYSGQGDPTNLPASWYLHTAGGTRVLSNSEHNALMNPQSTATYTDANGTYNGWSDDVAQMCVLHQLSYVSGCFLDLLGPAGIRAQYNVGGGVPINPRTTQAFTALDYESMTGSVADVVRSATPTGAIVAGNGLNNGHAYYYMSSNTLNNYTDATEAEGWMNRAPSNYTTTQWLRTVQMVIDNGAAGSGALLQSSCECATTADDDAARTFDMATYLIANTGHAYFDYVGGPQSNIRRWQADSNLYHLNLGSPTQTYASAGQYLINGVYQRAYTGGLVSRTRGRLQSRSRVPGVSHAGGSLGDLGQGRGPQRLDSRLLAPRDAWRPAHRSPRIATGPLAPLSC